MIFWNLCSQWNWSATFLSPAVLDNFWYKSHPCLLTNLDIWIRWRHLVVPESWLWVAYHLHLDTFICTGNLLPLLLYGRGRNGGPRTGTFWGQWKYPGVLEVLNTEHLGKSSKETVKISWPFCTVFWATPGSENVWKNMPQDASGHPRWLLRGPSLPTVLLAAPAGSHLLLVFWYLVPQNISVWDTASFVMFRTTAPFLKLISSSIFSWE